jgi:hypothetical protein
MKINKVLFVFILILSAVLAKGQSYLPKISAETYFQGGFGKNAPFWLAANKYGIYSINSNQILARVSAIKSAQSDTDYFYGLDLVDRFDGQNRPMLHQGYVGYKYRALTAYAGIKESVFGNHYSDLSVGGALWSKNAQPIPAVYLGVPEFALIPYTFDRLELMGGIMHGWMGEKDQYVKNAYLHYKYFLFRVRLISSLKFSFGLHHAVQWGGISPIDGNLGGGFKEFKWAFTSSSSDGTIGPEGEKINAYGNSVSSYNAALEYQFSNFLAQLYYQNFCEDSNGRVVTFGWNYIHVGGDWRNKPDGLFGFLLKNTNNESIFKSFLFEYIHTTHQSGDPNKSGNDNYYNNYVYQSGWTYGRMTIGTPLLTSPAYTMNDANDMNIDNNAIIGFHTGVQLKLAGNELSVLNTYTINRGTIIYPYKSDKKQYSMYVDYLYGCKAYRNLYLGVEAGLDLGTMYGDNLGASLRVKKLFN